MHHCGCTKAIRGNAKCQMQWQPCRGLYCKWGTGKKQRQQHGQCSQHRQHTYGAHLGIELLLNGIHRQHQPCCHGQGRGKTKARRLHHEACCHRRQVQPPGRTQCKSSMGVGHAACAEGGNEISHDGSQGQQQNPGRHGTKKLGGRLHISNHSCALGVQVG